MLNLIRIFVVKILIFINIQVFNYKKTSKAFPSRSSIGNCRYSYRCGTVHTER